MVLLRTGWPAAFLLLAIASDSLAQAPPINRTIPASIRAAERARMDAIYSLSNAPEETSIALIGMTDGLPVYFGIYNDASARAIGARGLQRRTGALLTGAGTRIGLWDEGPAYADHQELTGRVTDRDGGPPSNHATHVAGTLAASGIDPNARGLAPGAAIISHDWLLHASEMEDAAQQNMLLSNHSYGRVAGWQRIRVSESESVWYWFGDPRVSPEEDYAFGAYDQDAAHFDAVTSAFPYFLPVVAAGNDREDLGPSTGTYWALTEESRWVQYEADRRRIAPDGGASGYDTIASFALAKNVLTVGSLARVVGANTGEDRVSRFSGMGPTDDGRIKPDLISPGEDIYSSVALGPASYRVSSGTSMAAPTVTGSLALLQELAVLERGAPLRAASLKGLALHTARDVGTAGPDFASGWGRFDAAAAAETLLEATRHAIELQEVASILALPHRVAVAVDTPGPLRITLSWTDEPGRPLEGRSPALMDNPHPQLVRDLDLRLTHLASGVVYQPYVLDPQAPQTAATSGDNSVDPIEQIFVPDAPPGSYAIDVSKKQAPTTPIAFTLLVSGAREDTAPVAVDSARADVANEAVHLAWVTRREPFPGSYVVERAVAGRAGFDEPLEARYEAIARIDSESGAAQPLDAEVATNHRYRVTDPIEASGTRLYRIYFVAPRSNTRFLAASLQVDVPAPERLAVASIYPNPFRERATVLIDVPESQHIVVDLVDILGRRQALLADAPLDAGRHMLTIEEAELPAGLYFVRMRGERDTATRSIIRLPAN